jgi:uncharacterized protein
MEKITNIRLQKDAYFSKDLHSPLTSAQKLNFKGLEYFPEAPDLRFELPVKHYSDQQIIRIQTSTGGFQEYQKFGKIKFSIEGQPVELTIFSNQHGYFLPFIDSLAGSETYPAGRYLEPIPLRDGKFLIDFNQAYNPY